MKVFDKFLDIMGFIENDEEDYQQEEEEFYSDNTNSTRKRGQLVAIANHNRDNVKVVLAEPTDFDDAQGIADNLKNKKAVIINLEKSEFELGKRIIDFVGGTAYAVGGTMQKIGKNIILVVPPNIDIGGEIKDINLDEQEEVFSWVSRFNKKGEI